jgi:hypothetical protein
MNLPRYSALAAKLLARHVSNDAASDGDRERGIRTIERAMRQRTSRRWLWTGGAALAGAAAFTLLWRVAFSTPPAGELRQQVTISVSPRGLGAKVRDPAGERELSTRAELQRDQAIETADSGGASLSFSTGTRIELAGSSKFGVVSRGQSERFVLARGELSTKVEKLRPGERFIVETPDAEVEVRGTMFRLAVLSQSEACGAGSRTRLEVHEGVVEVRSAGITARVGAGAHWPSDCVPVAAAPSANAEPANVSAARTAHDLPMADHGDAPALGVRGASASASASASSAQRSASPTALARQNDLFAEAVALRRHGDVAGALHAYQELIRRFPDSPLVENALVERMRLLLSSDGERAREEARHYLLLYPHGFAQAEAQRLLDPG